MNKNRLKGIRESMRLSQKELALLLEVKTPQLSAWEQGRKRIPDEQLIKIRKVCKLDSLRDIYVPPEE